MDAISSSASPDQEGLRGENNAPNETSGLVPSPPGTARSQRASWAPMSKPEPLGTGFP